MRGENVTEKEGVNNEEWNYALRKMRRGVREWLKYPSIKDMAKRITGRRKLGSWGTVEIYVNGVKRFCKYMDCGDPETALEMLRKEADVTKKVDGFIDWLLERYSYKGSRSLTSGVKKWLKLNDIPVKWSKIEMPSSTEVQEVDRAPTREELQRLFNYGTLKDRVVISIAVSSGLRVGTLLSLTWGDVSFDYPDVARIKVLRRKGRKLSASAGAEGRFFFITWITPEAKNLLLDYKRLREQRGEVITAESPLIEAQGHFMNVESYERRWGRLLHKAGLNQKSKKWFILHFHTLRKFFRTRCTDADVKMDYREHWMTHKGGYLDESYFRPFEEEHLKEYRKAILYLTIYPVQEVTETERRKRQILSDAEKFMPPEKLEVLKSLLEGCLTGKQLDEALERFRKTETEKETEDCQKIVTEGELPEYLAKGWRIVTALPSGKIVVESANSRQANNR